MISRNIYLVVVVAFSLRLYATDAIAAPFNVSTCGLLPQPGSYKLTNNLTATGDCLVVTPPATIDLDGFTISGLGTGTGIRTDLEAEGVVIRNGTVRGFNRGIDILGKAAIDHMAFLENASVGVFVWQTAKIKDSLFLGNGVGADVGSASILADNAFRENRSIGAFVGSGSVVAGNTFKANRSDGLQTQAGSMILNNAAIDNIGSGLRVSCPSNVIGNTAIANAPRQNLVLVGGPTCNTANNVAP